MCTGRLKPGSRLRLYDTAREEFVPRAFPMTLSDISARDGRTFFKITENGRVQSIEVMHDATLWANGAREMHCEDPDLGCIRLSRQTLIALGCID